MRKIYTTFYQFLLVYKWQLTLFVISVICFSLTESIQPYFYKLFVDAIPQNNARLLFQVLLVFMAVRFLQVIFDLVTHFLEDFVVIPAARDVRLAVFKKIQDLDFAFHLSKSTGSLISAIKRGDSAFYNLFNILNINLTRIIINLLVVIIFFATIRWEISAIMIVSFLLNAILARFLIAYNMKTRKEFNAMEDEISAVIVDNLLNYETVKLFAKENWEYQRLSQTFQTWFDKFWKFANSFRAIDISVGTLGNLSLFAVILYALQRTGNYSFSPGEFIVILGFITSFYPRFFELIYKFRDITKNYADLETYLGILDQETLIKDPIQPIKKSHVKGEIEFNNVTFTYPEGKGPSLKNFNLKIRSGQSVALVGSSGVGKTTLVKLLMRFYDVDAGEILIDGDNIKNFTKSQLRSFMGVVPQEPILFNNTIGFNIGYAADQPTKIQIEVAAKMANLESFIAKLPRGYDTQVGERGIKLSGGQKQRLAIARMILSNPDVIIFDEATSHLDSQSEKLIQDAFWKAARNKTTLIVAHRLSTIVKADIIVVLKNGQVAEMGSHHQLLQKPTGLYTKFWNLQTHHK